MPGILTLVSKLTRRLTGQALSYHELTVNEAEKYCRIENRRVLVVGANTGEDCALFIRRGAAEVHGLDVIEDVGKNFPHAKATYHRESIEKTTLPSGYFDLIFSMATMEHVPEVALGFGEMARLVRSGGMIFSSSAPLWQSAYGHHMSCFGDHPWVHLLLDEPQLVEYARAHGIQGERGHDIEAIAHYMLNCANFNMLSAEAYISACDQLQELSIIENELYQDEAVSLDHPLGKRALAAGYSPQSLLASRHVFIARK